MQTYNTYSHITLCPHQKEKQRDGIVLVTIGNSLRRDDAIAKIIADSLPSNIEEELCRFDLESYSQFLLDCVVFHQVAVIVDATKSEGNAGSVKIINLKEVLDRNLPLNIKSCHGLSFFDELKIANLSNQLPDELYFFGVETKNTNWGEGLSYDLEKESAKITEKLSEFLKSIFLKDGF